MGQMRFAVTPPQRVTPEVLRQAYLSGIDRVAWPVQARMDGPQLVLTREVSDSAVLHLPWPVEGHGQLALSTGSLIEQAAPYQLPLELARGTVNQLRCQLAEWSVIGLDVPAPVPPKVSEATQHLSRAAITQEEPAASAASAEQAIRVALDAAVELTAAYVEQVLAARHRSAEKLPTLLAADLGASPPDAATAKQLLAAFNAAVVPLHWRQVEATEASRNWSASDKQLQWCKTQGLRVAAGPLLRLDPAGMPDWLYLWEEDFENLLSCVSDFVSDAVGRYRGKVDLWQAVARANTTDILSLSEEESLLLCARCLELIQEHDGNTPVVISVDQPWAEYTSGREVDFPPMHFVDALVRSGTNVSGVVLEINPGYHPGGTLPRNPLEFSNQLDRWSMLGLPLLVSIATPSAAHEDPLAARACQPSAAATPQSQQAWVARYLPLILAKSYVIGVIWNQLHDALPHDFPHGGLFDAKGQAKPALNTLATLRRTHLR